MQRPKTSKILSLIAVLINTQNNDADKIVEVKRQISAELNGMEVDDDPGFVELVQDVVDLAAAAGPPTVSEVEASSHFGEVTKDITLPSAAQ